MAAQRTAYLDTPAKLPGISGSGFFAGQEQKEPKAWGIFLADVIRHIANAQNEETGASSADTVQQLLDSLNAELEAPTSKAEGSSSAGA